MALKTLMLRKRINDAKKELEALNAKDEALVAREAELEISISEVNTEEERDAVSEAIDEFEAEKKDHEEKKADLERQVADLEAELQEEEKEQDIPEEPAKEERKEISKMNVRESKEYLHAYAEMIRSSLRTGLPYDESKLREMLTRDDETPLLTENASGVVPLPTYVEGRIRTAWERNGIMDLVRKAYVNGNYKVGFEVSATGATKHTEGGAAITEEELIFGSVTLIAHNFKKYLRVSDEVLDSKDEEFLDYLYDEIAYQISKAVVSDLITQIKQLGTSPSTSAPCAAKITSAPALDVLAKAVANLSDEADDTTAVMNKLTFANFVALQAAANYAFDPFTYVNRYRFSSALPAYDTADGGAVYCIVGDFAHGTVANFPAGADIKFIVDPYTDAERDLVKIVGRQFLGIGPVACYAFTNIAKAGASA